MLIRGQERGLIKKELSENSRIAIENLVDLDPSDSAYLKAFLYLSMNFIVLDIFTCFAQKSK